jgi:hypothetical protein
MRNGTLAFVDRDPVLPFFFSLWVVIGESRPCVQPPCSLVGDKDGAMRYRRKMRLLGIWTIIFHKKPTEILNMIDERSESRCTIFVLERFRDRRINFRRMSDMMHRCLADQTVWPLFCTCSISANPRDYHVCNVCAPGFGSAGEHCCQAILLPRGPRQTKICPTKYRNSKLHVHLSSSGFAAKISVKRERQFLRPDADASVELELFTCKEGRRHKSLLHPANLPGSAIITIPNQ